MPRVEIIPAGWETSKEKAHGDGTPTVNLCRACGANFQEGDKIDEVAPAGMPEFDGGTIGSIDVDHPPFEDQDYKCGMCDEPLTNEDN